MQPPKYQDTLAWTVFVAPLQCYYSGQANFSWFMRFRVKGEEYGRPEKALLTQKALKMDALEWSDYSEAEQDEWMALELWDKANLKAYEAEQNSATSPKSAKQKREERQAKRRTGKFVMDD